jgi:hypothetical protein
VFPDYDAPCSQTSKCIRTYDAPCRTKRAETGSEKETDSGESHFHAVEQVKYCRGPRIAKVQDLLPDLNLGNHAPISKISVAYKTLESSFSLMFITKKNRKKKSILNSHYFAHYIADTACIFKYLENCSTLDARASCQNVILDAATKLIPAFSNSLVNNLEQGKCICQRGFMSSRKHCSLEGKCQKCTSAYDFLDIASHA